MAAIHMIVDYPMTLCGVDVEQKTGAAWTMDEEEATCKNCRVSKKPNAPGRPDPVRKEETLDDYSKWEQLRNRKNGVMHEELILKSMDINIRVMLGRAEFDEEKQNLSETLDAIDMARCRLQWAADRITMAMKEVESE